MGLFMRMGFVDENERKPGSDEAGVLRAALDLAARDLAALSTRAGGDGAQCLEFQLALLDDETLIAPTFARIGGGDAADIAWRHVMDNLIREYGADPSEYVQARCLDVADLRDRVLCAFPGGDRAAQPPSGAIVIAEDLPPSRFLEIDWSKGGGIALSRGSEMSHTAILARAYGVPMLVQTGVLPNAMRALVDADCGFVELDPSDESARACGTPAFDVRAPTTMDLSAPATYRGERVRLLLNIEGPESLSHPAAAIADGVGLMRTEFLFPSRGAAPDEDAQFAAYAAVLRWAGERPVTIRTVDAGGDKSIKGLSEESEANPALGLRGLRLSLRRPDAFVIQLRALARAAVIGHLKVMFPFVTLPSEFETARSLFQRTVEELRAEGRDARLPELGMMVEVPGAALTLRRFEAAFFSIGSNDLAQFMLACDRANGAVSSLFDPMHPAVLLLIRRIVEDGGALGKCVSLCGDVAADPSNTRELMKAGLRELSMGATALAAVKGALLKAEEARLD
jgi:phosphotransferase system enzyme I (PtsI)